jgi:diacylglycerol kinase (ATP)
MTALEGMDGSNGGEVSSSRSSEGEGNNAMRRAALIVNRRGRRGRKSLDAGLRVLEDAGIDISVHLVRDPKRFSEILQRAAADADMLILGGGDGTLCLSLEDVLRTGLPLGILPLGNANDLARTLSIPAGIKAACEIIAAGHTRRIDLGCVNGKHFFNVASMGVSVRIARRLTNERKRRFGLASYVFAAWEAITKARSFSAEVVCDGKVEHMRAIQIAVGNGRYYGGGLTVADNAAIDDGRLDLYALARAPFWKLVLLIPLLRLGKHRYARNVQIRRAETIEITTDRTLSINTDGELTTRTPASFRVVRGALEVFTPRVEKQREEGLPDEHSKGAAPHSPERSGRSRH